MTSSSNNKSMEMVKLSASKSVEGCISFPPPPLLPPFRSCHIRNITLVTVAWGRLRLSLLQGVDPLLLVGEALCY